jgi:hypothetical protein
MYEVQVIYVKDHWTWGYLIWKVEVKVAKLNHLDIYPRIQTILPPTWMES